MSNEQDERPVVMWRDGRTPSNLCSTTKKNGEPCKRPPIQGATVCRAHGGAAPQVKRKAQERLLEGVPKMLRMLQQIASDETLPPAVRLAAIRDWLDRAGIDRKIEIDITSSSFDQLVLGAIAVLEDEHTPVANAQDYLNRVPGDTIVGELASANTDDIDYSPGGERHNGRPVLH